MLEDNTQTDVAYKIPTNNVYKAQELLDRSSIMMELLQMQWCRKDRVCNYACHDTIPMNDILQLRYKKLQHERKGDQVLYMGSLVAGCSTVNGRRQLTIGDKPVCCNFWMKALATSTNTYKNVLAAAENETKVPGSHGNKDRRRETLQNLICTSFWRDYFATFCQTSDREMFYWPVGTALTWVYKEKFPKFCKEYFSNEDMPSKTCFSVARHSKEFCNVKKRKNHYHIRCSYCQRLGEERRIGFVTDMQAEENAELQRVHDKEIMKWHGAETDLSILAAHSPGKTQVFLMDDTSAIEFPHCSHRLPKNVAKLHKLPFIPSLVHDVNTNKKVYLYSLKGRHKKGGNRFCTTMYHHFKAAKTNPTSPAACARDAVIIGDNYNENRNTTNLCFASEVIMAGWYDSITFLYGLLGHTHFGGDRDHRIHNQILAALYSNQLVDWCRKYPQAWPQASTRPLPAFIDYQYDWDRHYEGAKIKIEGMNQRIANFGGPFLIASFKVQKE